MRHAERSAAEAIYLTQLMPDPSQPRLTTVDLALTSTRAQPLGANMHHVGGSYDGPWCKTVHRAARRIHNFLNFFEVPHSLTGSALCGVDPVTGNTTVYTGLELGGGRPFTFATGSLPGAGLRELAELAIITGLCLWPEAAVRLVTATGQRIPLLALRSCQLAEIGAIVSVEWDGPQLSVAEIDSCARLAGTAAALAASASALVPTTIAVQLPRLQYYGFVEPLLRSGKMRPELGLHVAALVDDRRCRLNEHLRWQLELRLPAAWRSRVQVVARPELDHFADRVYQGLTRGQVLGVEDLAADDRRDPIIAAVLHYMRPRTIAQLGVAAYVAEYLRAGLSRNRGAVRVAVAVENDQERRILTTARQLAPSISRSLDLPVHLAGLYPLGRLWATRAGIATRPDLYQHTPRRWVRDSAAGELVDLHQLCQALYPASRQPYPAPGGAAVLESA
ncbi:hypothetical protein [Nonomuraea sp. NPDC003754]